MTTREYMAKKLQEFRKAKGLNVNEVGKAISKSGKTISAWEVGRGQPDADMLVALCKLYGVRIADFYAPDPEEPKLELASAESALLDSYRSLNEEGQSRVIEYARALVLTGDYREKSDR